MGTRLYKTAEVTAGSHAITVSDAFLFQPVPQGSVWTGTIQILNAPASSFHSCQIGGVVWAEWNGYQPSPVIQAILGETIEVDSFGLNAGVAYQAALIGTAEDENGYVPVWPLASPTPVKAPGSSIIVATTPFTTTQNLGPFDVSQFQAIQVSFLDGSGGGNGWNVELLWSTPAGAQIAATQYLCAPGTTLERVVPVQGSFVQIILTANGGGLQVGTLSVNAYVQPEYAWGSATFLAPSFYLLLDTGVVAVNTGLSNQPLGSSSFMYAGPVTMYIQAPTPGASAGQVWRLRLNFWNGASAFVNKWIIGSNDLPASQTNGPGRVALNLIFPAQNFSLSGDNLTGTNGNFIVYVVGQENN